MEHLRNDCYLIMTSNQTPELCIIVIAHLDPEDSQATFKFGRFHRLSGGLAGNSSLEEKPDGRR